MARSWHAPSFRREAGRVDTEPRRDQRSSNSKATAPELEVRPSSREVAQGAESLLSHAFVVHRDHDLARISDEDGDETYRRRAISGAKARKAETNVATMTPDPSQYLTILGPKGGGTSGYCCRDRHSRWGRRRSRQRDWCPSWYTSTQSGRERGAVHRLGMA